MVCTTDQARGGMAKKAEDTPECSYQSLDLDLDIGHTLEVEESSMFCSGCQ